MDESELRLMNGGEDDDVALERALALSMRESAPEGEEEKDDDDASTASEASAASTASTESTASVVSIASGPADHARGLGGRPEVAIRDHTWSRAGGNQETASQDATTRASTKPGNNVVALDIAGEDDRSLQRPAPQPVAQPGLLQSLDRRAMEAERLARRQRQLATARQAPATQALAEQNSRSLQGAAIEVRRDGHEVSGGAAQATPARRGPPPATQATKPTQQRPAKRKASDSDIIYIDDDDSDDSDDYERFDEADNDIISAKIDKIIRSRYRDDDTFPDENDLNIITQKIDWLLCIGKGKSDDGEAGICRDCGSGNHAPNDPKRRRVEKPSRCRRVNLKKLFGKHWKYEELDESLRWPRILPTDPRREPVRSLQSVKALKALQKRIESGRPLRLPKPKPSIPNIPFSGGVPMRAARPATTAATSASAASADPPSSAIGLQYPHGVVKKTWVRGNPRLGDDITLEEIWQKDDLKLALLSSFQWDTDWLMSKIDWTKTNLYMIAYAQTAEDRRDMMKHSPPTVQFIFPRIPEMCNMHSKLQILRFSNFLRIVVPTGNLVPYDWGEQAAIENMVFLIDLPRLNPEEIKAGGTGSTPFLEDLSNFLIAQDVEEKTVRTLRRYDFSETSRYGFVCSIPGQQRSSMWERIGCFGLGRAVRSMGWATDQPIEIDYLCSSIGAVNNTLLRSLYYACQGYDGTKEYADRMELSRLRPGTTPSYGGGTDAKVRHFMRVYFPSQETVDGSWCKRNGAGTICFQARWWAARTFPREILRDSENVRQGVLLHSKVMYVRRTVTDGDDLPGFAYVGSANMSESAWGTVTKDRTTDKLKVVCRNWESGVLVPVDTDVQELPAEPSAADSKGKAPALPAEHAHMLDMFRRTVPVPIALPGTKFVGSGRTPWFAPRQPQ